MQEFPIAPFTSYLFYIVGGIVAVIAAVAFYFAYSIHNCSVVVEGDKLEIKALFYGRTLERSKLKVEEARLVNLANEPELQPKKRRNGLSLSQFRLGMFQLANGEDALLCLSNPEGAVYIPTSVGYSLLVSPSDPKGFLAAVRR
jgi:hypothetical protein